MELYYEQGLNHLRIFHAKNMTFPPHLHTHIEILYLLEGRMKVTIGGQEKELGPKDLSIAFPNQIHTYETKQGDTSNAILAIFPIETSGEYMNLLLKEYPIFPFISCKDVHQDIPYALNSCLEEIKNNVSGLAIKSLFQLILARAFPHLKLIPTSDKSCLSLTAQLVTYLSKHFTEEISLEQLSNHFGISKYGISRIFSQKLNTSFSSYINTLRIDYGKTLLKSSDLDILSISFACGYEQARTFNREFVKITGSTPRDYRKEMK